MSEFNKETLKWSQQLINALKRVGAKESRSLIGESTMVEPFPVEDAKRRLAELQQALDSDESRKYRLTGSSGQASLLQDAALEKAYSAIGSYPWQPDAYLGPRPKHRSLHGWPV